MVESEFILQKETPGTYRYLEVPQVDKPLLSGTFYLKKDVFPNKPLKIRMIIKVVE